MVEKDGMRIEIVKDGPYLVSGRVPLAKEMAKRDRRKVPTKWSKLEDYPDQDRYALCRCGASKEKPYCDGSHTKVRFDGTETASHRPFSEEAERREGSTIDLLDVRSLCAGAQFCHRAGGIWDLVKVTDDAEARRMAIEIVGQCPTGRLVVCDKSTGMPIEPPFEKSITMLEDPGRHCSGPLWVKGGIPIRSAKGFDYEVRNRVTLCRCGHSKNKPFCDGAHVSIRFNDGDRNL
jgi:CDGSH-type Zn-finger protein